MQLSLFDGLDNQNRRPTDDEITRAKERHYGMVLVFRIGDGYQLFDDDAALASRVLGLELRATPRPVASFPVQSLDMHLRTLLRDGHRVAVCDRETP
jgi:DNA mismatch repair protein MutS